MKNIFKYMAVVAFSVVTLSLIGCDNNKPEPEPSPEPNPATPSSTYAFIYQGRTLEAGQTVYVYPTESELANDWVTIHFMMENKTESNSEAYIKVERTDGPEGFDNLTICFGTTCKTGVCPWTYGPLNLVPGINTDLEVSLDYIPSIATTPGVYRITIGKGEAMEDPQVMYLSMSGQVQ